MGAKIQTSMAIDLVGNCEKYRDKEYNITEDKDTFSS